MKYLFLCIQLLVVPFFLEAQSGFTGLWEGKLNAGVELQVVFRITSTGKDTLKATMDIPDQGLKNINITTVKVDKDSIWLEIGQFQARYSGKLQGDSIIHGLFQQGVRLPLHLKKVDRITTKPRPQTPQPPFPYRVEDIVYYSKDSAIAYGATITIPQGKGPFPAVLLITGSGQQNRDEEIMGHKPFAVIADYFTRHGLVVLRVDDRGMGNTTGDLTRATTRDFANDALVSVAYLKSRKEVNRRKLGLVGHSEGGMIAQMIAAERKDIHFIVLLAAPGENMVAVMTGQNEAFLTKAGLPKAAITAYLQLYKNIIITAAQDTGVLQPEILRLVNNWVDTTSKNIVVATTGIRDSASTIAFVDQFANQLAHPWFNYFLKYEPASRLKKIRANVLALNGANDIQVIAGPNLAAMEKALQQGQAKTYAVKMFPELNHLFQHCKACTVAEYNQLEETFSLEVLAYMVSWIKKIL